MTIRFTCAECASVLKIKDELAGTSGRCPKCKTKFVVPAPQPDHERLPLSEDVRRDHEKSRSTDGTGSGQGRLSGQILTEQAPDKEHAENHELPNRDNHRAPGSLETQQLEESDDQLRVNSDSVASDGAPQQSPVAEFENTVEQNLDCPPMLVLVQHSQSRTVTLPPQSHRNDKSSFAADKEFFSARPTLPPPSAIEPFDPSKFLMPDPPAVKREFVSGNDSSDEISELALSDDSDIDLEDRPEPRPISRPTPAVAPSRTPPEKIDLATAAKMMKKAIKDNQAAESHQRELDANAGFDYGEIFREFGLKGLGILAGGIVASFLLYYVSSRMYGNPLHLPKLGYVNGSVKLDGQPLPGAMIFFSPMEVEMEGMKRDRIRTSAGVTDANGNFRMMYIPGDRIEGVAVGRCRVWVDHVGKSGRSDIPPEWTESAMQIKEVTPGRQKTPIEINMQSRNK